MSAREEILGRVRVALEGQGNPAAYDVPAAPQVPVRPRGEVLDRFAERVADYRATVERCTRGDVGGVVAAALDRLLDAVPADARHVLVPEGLDLGGDVAGRHADGALDGPQRMTPGQLDAVHAVVTGAAVGIAETGTIVLDHGPGQGRRALTLVPDVHVCVVRADQVVPDVADALARLDPSRPTTWISGPSATSDIELDRVEGVHGPRTLHVVLVDD